jgi:hypothetical protein
MIIESARLPIELARVITLSDGVPIDFAGVREAS